MNVLIIGGSSDIGISLANYLVNNGNKVIVTYYKNKCNIDKVDTVFCDVKKEESIDNAIRYVMNEYGKVDILINMAAISLDNDFTNKSKSEFMQVLEVNLVGTFLCNKIYDKYMDNGFIINIASTDGIDTYNRYNIDYAASKAGVISISKSISMATSNKVLCICPNWIDSNSTRGMDNNYLESELKRIGQSRLISLDEFNMGIEKIMKMKSNSGDIFRLDIRDDKLWIEQI